MPARLRSFAVLVVELALLLLVVHLYDIEARRHFLALLCLACGGFVIHAWLPGAWRPAFFVTLSLGSILFVLGWPSGAWVIGLGGGLIALCYVPLSLPLRVAVLVVAGCGLAVWRMGSVAPFWPILGSMFMLRLILYVYENRAAPTQPPPLLTLGYFFSLPNICFTFFPVIDFKTYRETYRTDDAYEVYQTGVAWIVRGISHLLLYRLIKFYLLPSPFDVTDLPHLLLFLAASYALYLHISGQFHIITGILHLFGFDLPRTHLNYFLASSFTDIWRRINIYWKDFMMKVFFLPAFFRLRGLGNALAITVATLWVFLMTWLLHSYQVFWLLDDFPISAKDACLWLVVGVLVVINLQWDLRRRAGGAADRTGAPTMWSTAFLAMRIAWMFLLVSLFWACWTMPGFLAQASSLVSNPGDGLSALVWLVGLLLVAAAVGMLMHWTRVWFTRRALLPLRSSFARSAALQAAGLSLLVVAASPPFIARLSDAAAEMLANLRQESLTPAEAAQLVQGYYEEIAVPRVQAGALLASLEGNRPPDPGAHYADITRPSDDFLERELIPNWAGEVRGKRLTINRFGMRDRANLTLQKPAGTYRVALVGSSIVMGFGVGDDETFPRLVEERLNAGRSEKDPRYELLNFGTGLSSLPQRRAVLDRKVFGFEPDAVFYVAHPDEFREAIRHLGRVIAGAKTVPYPSMRNFIERHHITVDLPRAEIDGRLHRFASELALDVYREIVAECRARGVRPVWIYVPLPGISEGQVRSVLVKLASEAGFRVVDLAGWWGERRPEEALLSARDHHPNALGQRLIAESLVSQLKAQGGVPP